MPINIEKIKSNLKNLGIAFINNVTCIVKLFLATDMPLYSANAAFFLLTTCIPLFMLLFSSLSYIPAIQIDDLIANISFLFPSLPNVRKIVESIIYIAKDLSSKNAISINIIIALFTGSTTLYTFTIGIRKIHNITHASGFIRLRLLSIINMFVFFIAFIMMFTVFILGSMILGFVTRYFPFAENIIHEILSFRYGVAAIVLLVLMISIYSTSTNFERKIRHNILGAFFATLLWLVISNIFSIYFKTFPLNASIYGSLAGIVIVLMWLYICMNIIFLGAVINEVICPQIRILEEQKKIIMEQLEKGVDKDVDKIINDRYKLKKVTKFDRPTLH